MSSQQEMAARGGGRPDPERSWKSMGQTSGTVAAAGGGKKEDKPKPKAKTAGPATGTYTASYAKPKGKDKPKTEKETKPTSAKIAKPASAATTSSKPAARPKAAAKKPATPVSQSRTMWVKKGEMVGGKEVKKGYLAQYGKPEKRVTAPVKLVEATKRGKVGEMVEYKKGRYKKKSGK
jgi:hypothetical protein